MNTSISVSACLIYSPIADMFSCIIPPIRIFETEMGTEMGTERGTREGDKRGGQERGTRGGDKRGGQRGGLNHGKYCFVDQQISYYLSTLASYILRFQCCSNSKKYDFQLIFCVCEVNKIWGVSVEIGWVFVPVTEVQEQHNCFRLFGALQKIQGFRLRG